MRIVIVSDSHLVYNLSDLYDIHKPDMMVHAGDSQLRSNNEYLNHFDVVVRGNCDFEKKFEQTKVVNEMFVTHGHLYDVNYGLGALVQAAREHGCNTAIYGHSHVVNVSYDDGVLLLNPGSVSQSRCAYPTTYMLYDTSLMQIDLYDARNHEVIEVFDLKTIMV